MSRHVLTVIDVETTGLEPPAEVIELGWQDVIVEDGAARLGNRGSRLFGAERGIPPETMAVHHIRPGEIEGQPLFGAHDLEELLHGDNGSAANDGAPPDALVAHNAAFETLWFTPTLIGSMPVICTLKAALRVWPDAPGHSNSVLRYWLGLDLDDALAMPPHRAGPDAYVTANILVALFNAGATGKDMVAWTREPALLPRCPIGKFRGQPWASVDGGFLNWMLAQPSMEADLKWNAQRELDRRRLEKAA